jgi:hypothetical protein
MNLKSHLSFAVAICFGLAAGPALAASVRVASSAPYAEDAEISSKIRTECVQLQTQLPAYTAQFGKEFGVEVALADDVSPRDAGRVLQLEIYEAVSMGNAFIGHQKYSKVRGTLFEDGQEVAGFKGMRNSMGGAFGGYKGSCSVLGRTVKALGKDIAQWLVNPQDGALLGDL